jgi:hypothetical protein
LNSEIMKLKASAEAQGFVVDLTENSHIRWRPPRVGGNMVISTRSPGGRDLANLVADLKRVGYKTEEDIKREQRRTKKILKLMEGPLSPHLLKVAAEQLDLSETIGLVWGAMSDSDYDLLSRGLATEITDRGWYDLFLRGEFKEDPFTQLSTDCQKCDKSFNTLFARFKHEEKCGTDEPEKKAEPTVDRIPCPVPECESTFHKNNPTSRLNHMQTLHNITECPNCYKVMQPSSLDRHLSDNCTVLKRGLTPPIKRTRIRMDASPPLPPTDPFLEDKVIDVVEMKKPAPIEPAPPVAISPAPVAPTPAPVDVPAAPTTPVPLATDDETLWTLLEMVMDGPVILDRHLWAVANEWLATTKKLRELAAAQRSS